MFSRAAKHLKVYPFVRLLGMLITGIIIQWYLHPSLKIILCPTVFIFCVSACFLLLNDVKKFSFDWLRGVCILLLFVSTGMMLTWAQNIRNNPRWFNKIYKPADAMIVTIEEPLVEKPKSFKALASINAVDDNNKWQATKGYILLYFKKHSIALGLKYGSQIVLKKTLLSIQNSGNPAALDYNRFCLFQSITNQVFLSGNDYVISPTKNINYLNQFLFSARDVALKTMQQNIHSQKALGIAEALLIGYRNDLDKDLVQAYSNTGVVHIIAISGMHIAIIYAMLVWFFKILKPSKLKKWLEPITILLVIWVFTLIAGAAPSISRASVMFTCILVGKFLNRNGNIYNTLAASAFVLLVYNPFNLWDVGFQLSYAAVFSIVTFFKTIYTSIYIKNKLLDKLWQLTSVTLAAQIFAIPIVIYHFHQLPILFLISNLIAVPLSGFILYAELALFCFSWWHAAAAFIGNVIEASIKFLNGFIQYIDQTYFSVWDGLHISIWQLFILFGFISAVSIWLLYKSKVAFITSLYFTIVFFILRDIDIFNHSQQQKLIVYNVPQHTAIDFISSNSFCFSGDSLVLTDVSLRNFNLRFSRIEDRISVNKNILIPNMHNKILNLNGKKILLLDQHLNKATAEKKIKIDVIIITEDIKSSIRDLQNIFDCNMYVLSGKIPLWKADQLKKDCAQLHLRLHSVSQQAAFVLKF